MLLQQKTHFTPHQHATLATWWPENQQQNTMQLKFFLRRHDWRNDVSEIFGLYLSPPTPSTYPIFHISTTPLPRAGSRVGPRDPALALPPIQDLPPNTSNPKTCILVNECVRSLNFILGRLHNDSPSRGVDSRFPKRGNEAKADSLYLRKTKVKLAPRIH